ncbi:MAG: hypothetical protein KDD70_04110 [Bdellovibrionales bacterium]|nr:hypothetical protein [Bdellovibrionales bacterium]
MNELEAKRLAKVKPQISPALVDEFANRIEAFQQYGQYEVLSGVHLAQFFSDPENVPESLKQKTVEDIVLSGAFAISLEPQVTSEHITELLVILSKFTPEKEAAPDHSSKYGGSSKTLGQRGEGEIASLRSAFGVQSTRGEYGFRDDIPMMSSVEAERKLVERYGALRNHPNFQTLKSLKVSDYWDTSIVRAPFLEELTFREVLEISVDHLLKKRSVGNSKIHCLVKAFDSLLESHLETAEKVTPNVGHDSYRVGEGVGERITLARPVKAPKWRPSEYTASATARALVAQWEGIRRDLYQSEDHSRSPNILSVFVTVVPELLTEEQFLSLWFTAERKPDLAEAITGMEGKDLEACKVEASRLLLKHLEERCSSDVNWIRKSAEGLGAPEEALFYPYQSPALTEGLRILALRIVMRVLGATHPRVGEEEMAGFWTFRPEGLAQLLSKVLNAGSVEEQTELLQTLAPQFPTEVVLSLVEKGESGKTS